ncbi:MAG: glycosyltransferase family 2 protein [Anaerolineae bacterium]|jgi:glycosyltransferase involved in cell wall biosynthesis|nr:glycosyltransferase family 2 protein [Anaerolineae bacterium]MBT3714522.1 glycosyltransferase family 2 protein [Anaerolineae bacterium]MBT4308908.1 glycosyltransferase family 2 protein [Anaerolineae bacterium]MBT4459059.1 glycosyltransferase family 2 protein [Anaerolineae bacterium]MBT6061218.1 glycosyltransferase family 2 protein [Anaerolineae bacterium]
MPSPFLSLIIPAYNEENRLPQTLEQVFAFLVGEDYLSEVIVVENGSTDKTLELAQKLSKKYANLRVLQNEKAGKGLAVQRGMLAAKGEYRIFCDADLSMPIEEVSRFIPPHLDTDIVIASREVKGAIRYDEPEYRHFTGRIFNLLIRLLALPKLHDTQCGFKGFRAEIAEDLFQYQSIEGWAFDVEILFIARMRGYEITELPIPWYYNGESKINVLRDSFRMFLDLIQIRKNARQGLYGSKKV